MSGPVTGRDAGLAIRPFRPADLPEIQGIYAHHVLHGTGTFEDVPPSVEEMAERVAHVTGQDWPWLVAEDGSGVLGYCYLTRFRPRVAYRYCAENAVYVRHDVRGQGVGKALVARLIEAATAAGFRQMVAVIGDTENVGSIGMHASLGFQRVGTLRGVGRKFGRWVDTVYMQRALGEGEDSDPA
jgi:L-amino acid N-acyltransferase YncA